MLPVLNLSETQKYMDARFEEALQRQDLDYPRVALQAAQMLSVDEVLALARTSREDGLVNQGSRNLLELARHALLVSTIAWDGCIVEPGQPWDHPCEMASELSAATVRSLVFVGNQTLQELQRAVAYQVLGNYTWRVSASKRYAYALAVVAMAEIPQDELAALGREAVNARFLNLLLNASLWLQDGPWNDTKASDLKRLAELTFTGFTEPAPVAVNEARKEQSWAERLAAKMRVGAANASPEGSLSDSAFNSPLFR